MNRLLSSEILQDLHKIPFENLAHNIRKNAQNLRTGTKCNLFPGFRTLQRIPDDKFNKQLFMSDSMTTTGQMAVAPDGICMTAGGSGCSALE